MARPRGVEDEVILRATARVMGRVGPAGFTLAAVAREVGLVPGTLVQRFGSKRGLLLALAGLSAREAGEAAGRVRGTGGSALGALTALATDSAAGMGTPESFAHHLAFLCADLTDPELRAHALTVHRAQDRAVTELLTEAVALGELRPDTEVTALARTVRAVTTGAGLSWALDHHGGLAERIRQELDAVLRPHLAPGRPAPGTPHDHPAEQEAEQT
ncbi:helix-turn-helix domain-containing protein [Streptomyces sp. NPDC047014]|uniref:helix-turn-helix domain-containing protein n=1 Tax=Streptomyces sp. NPDC047014 TaxID=3155736 RepID=UPI0033F1B567